MIVEYTHRILAATVTVMIAVLAVQAWRLYRQNTALVRTAFAALGLIFLQAALGGLTVEKGLEEELVAIHLGVAMLQIALLLLIARLSQPDEVRRPAWRRPASTRAIRALAVFASAAVLATIVAGGYVAGTEKNGTPGEHRAVGAHEACGNDFPSCGGEFMPFGRSTPIDIQLTHRALMYLASALVLALFAAVLAQRRRLQPEAGRTLTAAAATSVGLLVVQVLLGATNVWAGEHAWLIVAHLTIGTVLWLSLVRFALAALDVPAATRTAPARRATAEAATA
jgi:heme A synthase